MLGAYLVQLLHGCGQFGYSQAQTVKQRKSENKRGGGREMPYYHWLWLQTAIISAQKCSVSHKSPVLYSILTENSNTQL